MADLNGIEAAQAVKIIGSNSSGLETTPVAATSLGAIHSNLRDALGTELGTASNPIKTDPTGTTVQPVSSVDTTASGSITAVSQSVAIALNGKSGVAVQITGTWVGTLQFEGTVDGTNWATVNGVVAGTSMPGTTTAANGIVRLTPSGLAQVRATSTAWTSGTAAISLRASDATGGTFLNQSLTAGSNIIGKVGIDPGQDITASASFTAVNQQIVMPTLGIQTFFVRITGTFSGLAAFEGEVSTGVWVIIRGAFLADTGVTTDFAGLISQIGTGFVNPTGYLQFRVRCHTYISGTMGIVLTSSVKPTVSLVQPVGPWAVALREGLQPTYSASITNLVAGTTPTDIFTLSRSGTKGVRITRIRISATQTTGTIRNVSIIKRSTANTGGTSTTLTAVPHSSFDAAAQSIVRAYTVNPTVLGTTVGTILSDKLLFGTSAVMIDSVLYEFGNGSYKAISLGSTESLCINLNGVTSAGNLINVSIEWIEQE